MQVLRFVARISQFTAILMSAGWIAVVCTAIFLPGGYPPLSGYVGIVVIIASWFLGTAGVLGGLASLAGPRIVRRNVAILFLCANAGLLAFSVLINFM